MKQVLMIAYTFPPCAASGVYRTLRFMKFLPDYGWKAVILTIKPDAYRSDWPVDPLLLEQVPPRHLVFRTSVFRWLDALLKLRDDARRIRGGNGKETSRNEEGDRPGFEQETARSWKNRHWKWVKECATGALSTPDEQIGWLPLALWRGMEIIRHVDIHAVYSTGSPWTAHLIGYWLRRLTGIPWVADFRDPWTQNPWRPKRSHFREKLEEAMERSVVGRADFIIANTPTLRDDFVQRYGGLSPEKFVTITNGFDPDIPLPPPPAVRDRAAPLTLTHTGSLYGERDPRPLLLAVQQLLAEGLVPPGGLRILLVGSSETTVEQYLARDPLLEKAVRLVPHVPYQKSLEYLVHSDVLLLIQPKTVLQIPAKLFEYIYAGKPLLALTPARGATGRLIMEERLGLVVEADDVSGIKKAIVSLYGRFRSGGLEADLPGGVRSKYDSRQLTGRFSNLLDRLPQARGKETGDDQASPGESHGTRLTESKRSGRPGQSGPGQPCDRQYEKER